MSEEWYATIKRIASIIVAIALWYLSLQFSVEGFSIQVPELAWAGWILGLSVTVIELIFTSQNRGRNVTLTFLGITAYTYGVWSNVVGIHASRGIDGGEYAGWIFSVVLGLILEIAPEPLFLWGFLGEDTEEGDFVSTLTRLWVGFQKRPVGRPRKDDFRNKFRATTEQVRPNDTVSSGPNYEMITRLTITKALGSRSGSRLIWDRNKSQSPVLIINNIKTPVSRSLVRQMVMDKTLIEKDKGGMIVEYVLVGSEPPVFL